jgi:flagellar basal-body rod protein FlgB
MVETMVDLFTDVTSATMAKCLDGVAIRHRVIADNIANVETPGFKRSDVAFEDEIRQAIESSDGRSVIDRVREIDPKLEVDDASPSRPDGNNVSIDREMASMTKNTMEYEALVQLMNLKGSMIRAVIMGGR